MGGRVGLGFALKGLVCSPFAKWLVNMEMYSDGSELVRTMLIRDTGPGSYELSAANFPIQPDLVQEIEEDPERWDFLG